MFPHHQAVHQLEAALQGVEPTEEELTFVMKMAGGRAALLWAGAVPANTGDGDGTYRGYGVSFNN